MALLSTIIQPNHFSVLLIFSILNFPPLAHPPPYHRVMRTVIPRMKMMSNLTMMMSHPMFIGLNPRLKIAK